MAINLASKYSDRIAEAFSAASFLKGRTSGDYDWQGVKSVKVYTPTTVSMSDYLRTGTSRYGTPTEVQDTVQEMILTQDKSFSLTVDKGNNSEQMGVKNAGRILAMQIKEQAVPAADRYAFARFVKYAGKVDGISSPTRTNVISLITEACAVLDDALVPSEGRTVYAVSAVVKLITQSMEFLSCERLADRALSRGVVGELLGMEVVKVPMSYFPAGVYFLVAHRSALLHPIKLSETKLHLDPPGISGHLLEGRMNYDAYVLGARCGGVYAGVEDTSVLEAPVITDGTGTFTIECTGADEIRYTTDGTDPRYSMSAKIYSAGVTTTADVTVKAVGFADDVFTSPVTTSIVTGA